jgi:propionyl-CoA carboxylase alpha chain
MPGAVVAVHCAVGDEVSSGQQVLTIEAMKMQHSISAPYDGVVAELPVSAGDQVTAGVVLAVIEQAPDTDTEPSTTRTGDAP